MGKTKRTMAVPPPPQSASRQGEQGKKVANDAKIHDEEGVLRIPLAADGEMGQDADPAPSHQGPVNSFGDWDDARYSRMVVLNRARKTFRNVPGEP